MQRRREPEGAQEEEDGDEPARPVDRLPEGDAPQVEAEVAQRREALGDPLLEVADLLCEPEQDGEQDGEDDEDRR